MRVLTVLFACALAAAACRKAAETRQYDLQGQVLAVDPARSEVVIAHGDIKGFMPAMTMPFKVKDASLVAAQKPGDLVTATLVVSDAEAYLSTMTTTGHAAPEAPAAVGDAPRVLAEGQPVADALLVDQDGTPRPFSSFRGHRVALTFVYTRCPLVEFCPMLQKHFRTVQQLVKGTPALRDVQLIAMTMDPEYDTPAVLKPHAERAGADAAVWSFMTGEPEDVSRFASQFGLYVERNPTSAIDITHNLITVVLDPEGRLVRRHTGNDWTPAELVADLTATPAPAHP